MGAVAGVVVGGVTNLAFVPISLAIVVGVGAGFELDRLEEKYRITQMLAAALKEMNGQIVNSLNNGVDGMQRSAYRSFGGFLRAQGYRGPF